jgi:ABC-type cobalamin/Fe3+-siderophores transport system ATPase subunit
MISKIVLQFGSSAASPPVEFEPGRMTVVVGPNSSGKSLLLREIRGAFTHEGQAPNGAGRILNHVIPAPFTVEELSEMLHRRRDPRMQDAEGVITIESGRPVGGGPFQSSSFDVVRTAQASQERYAIPGFPPGYRQLGEFDPGPAYDIQRLLAHSVVWIDVAARLTILNDEPINSYYEPVTGFLGRIHRSADIRERIQAITSEALGGYLVVDHLAGQFTTRFSTRKPTTHDETSTDESARAFMVAASPLSSLGDGARAFCGIVAAVLSSSNNVLLIDEPETFLHTPRIRDLGRLITSLAADRGGNAIVVTHNPEFLIGAIQSGDPTTVLRLTYQENQPTARLLAAEELRTITENALLRSSNVLSALFHESAVVCEADGDRVFYEEVNERLRRFGKTAVRDGLFVNGHGNTSLGSIAKTLRRMGVPAAIIADFDCIGSNLDSLLDAAFVPSLEASRIRELSSQLTAQGQTPKDGGIAKLPDQLREPARELCRLAAVFGLFFVPVGELEYWLSELGVPRGRKSAWLRNILEAMGLDSRKSDYLHPTAGDVWDFIGDVSVWTSDPARGGIPD